MVGNNAQSANERKLIPPALAKIKFCGFPVGKRAEPNVIAYATAKMKGFEFLFICFAKIINNIGARIATVSLIRNEADKPNTSTIINKMCFPVFVKFKNNFAPLFR